MKLKQLLRKSLFILLMVGLGYGIHYVWFAFPIISGFSAKNACSCLFIQGRTKEDILEKELGTFPLSLGSIKVNVEDLSVSGSVMGLATRKAIYRKGLGCTLINDLPESAIRAQTFVRPVPVPLDDTSQWLTKAPETVEQFNLDSTILDSALGIAFQQRFQDKAVHTSAVLVVRNGKIIAEQYANGYNATMPILGWSMAKSITGALIGILVKDGQLDIAEQAPVPRWKKTKDNRQYITTEHLLQQTSGLDFEEDYASYSHATNMLFYKGNMAAYVANLPSKEPPGQQFYYSSGNSNLLSQIIRQKVGEAAYHAFPYQRLFHKIGMYHTLLEPDASGTFVGSSYVHASARDYARFGLLYANDGVWNGERILPEGWVQRSVTAPATNHVKNYGYQFWLNGIEEDTGARTFPEVPHDMFMANGFGGQRIYIIPSKKLVVVRLGLNRFDEHQFLKTLVAAIK